MSDTHDLAKWARQHRKMLIFAEGIGGGKLVFVEFRSARFKRGHVLTEAQRAQTALGEVMTVPEQRW